MMAQFEEAYSRCSCQHTAQVSRARTFLVDVALGYYQQGTEYSVYTWLS